jgi:alkylhydroperoxidase/carboxymuconolactone decarboxylase family protein YurZ
MAAARTARIPPRALKRGTMLWNREFTERVAGDMADWGGQEFMELFMNFCYGGLYDRNVLPQKTRELCAVAACVMANALPQLRTHIQAAWNCGATKKEIMEVILQMLVYCGAPYASAPGRGLA